MLGSHWNGLHGLESDYLEKKKKKSIKLTTLIDKVVIGNKLTQLIKNKNKIGTFS